MSVGAVRCQNGTVCVMKGLWVSGGGVGQCGYQKGTVVCQEETVACWMDCGVLGWDCGVSGGECWLS